MDRRISKFITDPDRIEGLIKQYEAAKEANEKALNDLTLARSASEACAQWTEREAAAKTAVMQADVAVDEIYQNAHAKIDEANALMAKAKAEEENMAKVSEMLIEKENEVNKAMAQLDRKSDDLNRMAQQIEQRATKINSIVAELNQKIKDL